LSDRGKEVLVQIASTYDLFIHELGEIYDAEHRFLEGQEEMAREATNGDLEGAIRQHIEQTREHAFNIERVFNDLGQEPRRETNEVARGLVNEAQEAITGAHTTDLRDCAIVSSVIKVEHFEMGSYRSLITGAQLMGRREAEQLLRNNMDQEEETARIAESSSKEILSKAMEAEGQRPESEGLVERAKEKLSSQ
jgi:ferritin-like metal-binding protein YciE